MQCRVTAFLHPAADCSPDRRSAQPLAAQRYLQEIKMTDMPHESGRLKPHRRNVNSEALQVTEQLLKTSLQEVIDVGWKYGWKR